MKRLAILGGEPVNKKTPEFIKWPVAGELEKKALLEVLESGKWGADGEQRLSLSHEFAEYCGTKHALPAINGTTCLEMILRALGIGRGDEVVVSPYTFVASVHAIVNTGAFPVFADTDPETQNLSPESCEDAITNKTRAIMAVHMGGRPADLDALMEISNRRGIPLIEDASHAHGSEWKGSKVGSFGIAGAFSCQASKNISAGEGGIITTNDSGLYEKLLCLHDYGRAGGVVAELGTNARLAEWQCAILRAQLHRLDADNERRYRNKGILEEVFRQTKSLEPLKRDDRITMNSCHVFTFRYHSENLLGLTRQQFFKALCAENVCSGGPGYAEPIYTMKFMHSDEFLKKTGRKFMTRPEQMPGNEIVAHSEGCWFYHSTLLGEKEDTERLAEAIFKVEANAEALVKEFS